MIVIVTADRCSDNNVGKHSVAWKEYCAEYWLKELQESMDMCTSPRDVTEILLNTIQSINQSTKNDCYLAKCQTF